MKLYEVFQDWEVPKELDYFKSCVLSRLKSSLRGRETRTGEMKLLQERDVFEHMVKREADKISTINYFTTEIENEIREYNERKAFLALALEAIGKLDDN